MYICRINLLTLSVTRIEIFDYQMPTSLEFIMQFHGNNLRKSKLLWISIDTTTSTILFNIWYNTHWLQTLELCTLTLLSCLIFSWSSSNIYFKLLLTCRIGSAFALTSTYKLITPSILKKVRTYHLLYLNSYILFPHPIVSFLL